MQRGARAHVPRMATRCASTVSTSAGGTTPPSAGSASDQCIETRNAAQHAPQARQGWDIAQGVAAGRSAILTRLPRHASRRKAGG
ncbi:hypothetical protein GCM10027188_04700 [Lysobacter humi (ex Lee et al. 2017)]